MTASADPWAIDASHLPLAFSQVREDPRIDLEIANMLPPDPNVIMVASGGETAVCLSHLPLASLTLVDVNPAQLALTRCRFHLAATCGPAERMALLGHITMPAVARLERWTGIFETLDIASGTLASESMVGALGPDHCGRYETAFAELRRLVPSENIAKFLTETDTRVASGMIAPGTELGAALDSAFATVMRLENLVALFGEGATRNPRRPFHEHFPAQLREIVSRLPPAENPWIWQLLAGKYPPGRPVDWVSDTSPQLVAPTYVNTPMLEALDDAPEKSADFIHVSNILDWLSEDDGRRTLSAAFRVLRPGGYLLIRQLNSSLDIPSLFPAFHWHPDHGRRLQSRDRSFFYPEILLASRS